MLIADTGAIYAFYDGSDQYHHKVQEIINKHSGQIIIPEGILAKERVNNNLSNIA